ncbi:spore gernimation protein [Bacillus timonensis]|uniref:Spore gernimation protein n=1 Tax=Bacillus timonensis TaxID=1033734 RepID=A0A4S3PTC6_9BACI|nr:endospore germination permease [Bacillus timonensis]THE13000.1 spore gernimation protein [Bacillus timonensis]
MDKQREKITTVQLVFIVISSVLGVAMLAIPRFVVKGAGIGAPFASIIGVGITFIGLLAVVYLGKRFPKHTLITYNEIILGKFMGRFFSVIIILFFTVNMGLETRQFAEVVKTGALLPNTPIQVAIFMMIFLCVSTGFQNVSTFAYIHFFYMPLIIFPIALVLLPAFGDIEVYHITPFLGNDPTWREFLRGSIIVTQSTLSFFIISMVIPYMKQPKKCLKGGVWGLLIAGFIVIFIVFMTVGVFGDEEISQMIWPTLILGRMITVPGDILARVDAILVISWIYGVFTTLLSNYFLIVRGIGELFRYFNYRVIAIIGFPVVFCIAIFPRNIFQMYDQILLVTLYGLLLTIVYPVILLGIAKVRKKGGVSG